jgi:uncharacterized protein (DUF58 family)
VTRAAVIAGLGLSLCLAAGAFAADSLYVPGIALLLIVAAALGWVSRAARRMSVVRSIGQAAVEEQMSLPVTVRVLRSGVPLPGGELRAWTGGPALAVPRSRDSATTAMVRFPRRGRHLLGPATLLVGDPFRLVERRVCSTDDQVIVLPRVEPVRFGDLGGEAAILGRSGRQTASAEATEVDALQPHRPETPASRIHWPTLARTLTLMERRLVAEADQLPVVVVDPRAPASADALDRAMRAAASLCVHLARRGGCALLLPGDRRPAPIDPELHGWPELHTRLALLSEDDGAPPSASLTHARTVIWVTASPRSSTAALGLRAPLRYLISPYPRTGWPTQFTVAGCSGQAAELTRTAGRQAAG